MQSDNLPTLIVLDGFGLSHVLKPMFHAGAIIGHPCALAHALWYLHDTTHMEIP